MHLAGTFADINWLSVVVAALLAFAIGGLWYSPVLFGNTWVKELKISDETIKSSNMPLIFGLTFLLNLVGALVLDLFIGPDASLVSGLLAGLIISLAWVATSIGINYLFSRKSFRLFLIDAGYFVTFFPVMGAVLGIW